MGRFRWLVAVLLVAVRIASPASADDGDANDGGGFVSEIRIGALLHDRGPTTRRIEGGVNGNFEVLFSKLDFLDFVWSPRPLVGVSINSRGDISQAYIGLGWQWDLDWRGTFVGFSLGGSIHNGDINTDRNDKKDLGCRALFRESAEVGIHFDARHSLSLMFDHISNAYICSQNEGLDTFGVRYGYRF